jgi:hypothetical protein
MTTTSTRQTGYSAVAAAQGDSGNVQLMWLGNDDALPYLIWQSSDTGVWSAVTEPMVTSRPKGFDALAMCRGYQQNLCVILIDRETGQPYLLEQSQQYGGWTDMGFPVPNSEDSPRYRSVIMANGNSGNLQVLLLGVDGGAYLIYQNNSDGSWHQGTLPANPGVSFQTMAAANDANGNLQSIWIDTDGKPWLLWQANKTTSTLNAGEWEWWDAFPTDAGPCQAVTMHLGGYSDLQAVLLSTSGLPYRTSLDNDSTAWTIKDPLPVPKGTSFFALASGYFYDNYVQCLGIFLLEATASQLYLIGQNPSTDNWYTAGQLNMSNDHPNGFSALAPCTDSENVMQIPLLGADNRFPYLTYESSLGFGAGFSWYGMLPLPQPFAVEFFYTPPLSVEGVLEANNVSPSSTPGNVAVCLSGGGSRAMSAGMGQLQALSALELNGKSLLSQAKVLSTVSGGSWVGQTYCYLNDADVTDSDFLGTYVEPGTWTTDTVNDLDEACIGYRATPEDMSFSGFVSDMAIDVAFGAAPSMAWQIEIGQRILKYYGLYQGGSYGYPTDSFTYNSATLEALQSGSPGLVGETFHQIASQFDTSRATRPLPICNMSMAVNYSNVIAAPVQGTPFYTGIVNPLSAVDMNNMQIGGGVCQSFAFNSYPASYEASGAYFLVNQPRQWSLTDMIGVSSAAIGAFIWQKLGTMDDATLDVHLDEHARNGTVKYPELLYVGPDGNRHFTAEAKARIHLAVNTHRAAMVSPTDLLTVPQYYYWSPRNTGKISDMKPTPFSDGGFLENTGVAGALANTDIDAVVAFVNSGQAFEIASYGVIQDGIELANTNYLVDDQIPVLFGYQKYDPDRGYVTFAADDNKGTMSVCQIFPSESFGPLLQGLAMAGSGTTTPPSTFRANYPTTFLQTLTTVQNNWFSVEAGREIQVLWCYLNGVAKWFGLLDFSVENLFMTNQDGLSKNFPHYGTVTETQLTAAQVNMLANLTAWCVCDPTNSEPFLKLFQ